MNTPPEIETSPPVKETVSKSKKPHIAVGAITAAVALSAATCINKQFNKGIQHIEAVECIDSGRSRFRIEYNFTDSLVNRPSPEEQAASIVVNVDPDDSLDYYKSETISVKSIEHNLFSNNKIVFEVDICSDEYSIRKSREEENAAHEEAKHTTVEPVLSQNKNIYILTIPGYIRIKHADIVLRNSIAAFQKKNPHLQIQLMRDSDTTYKLLTFEKDENPPASLRSSDEAH